MPQHFVYGYPYTHEILGCWMQQNDLAIPAWQVVLAALRPSRVLEFGTRFGGFAVQLATLVGKEVRVFTYDVDDTCRHHGQFQGLGIHFGLVDLFDEGVEREIAGLIGGPGPTLVLCDNGNKIREFHTYARYLKPGDVIAAHDYGPLDPEFWAWCEIQDADVAEVCRELRLEPYHQETLRPAAWLCRRKQ